MNQPALRSTWTRTRIPDPPTGATTGAAQRVGSRTGSAYRIERSRYALCYSCHIIERSRYALCYSGHIIRDFRTTLGRWSICIICMLTLFVVLPSNVIAGLPTPTPTPTPPPIPRGVFCLDKAGVAADSSVLSNPDVDGIVVREWWSAIEPSDGTYDWSFFDSEVYRAGQAGKTVMLLIVDGGGCMPAWVRAGPGTTYTYTNPQSTVVTIPVFWDSYYLTKKQALITAFGNKYKNNSTVKVVGIGIANANSDDWYVPHSTTVDNAVGITQVQEWLNKGYTSQKLIDSCDTIIDAMMVAFPNQAVYIATNSNGILDSTPNYVEDTVISNERAKWGDQLVVGKNNLSAKTTLPPPPVDSFFWPWWNSRPAIAAQMLWFCYGDATYRMNGGVSGDPTTVLENAVNIGYAYGTQFQEIYKADVENLPTAITYAHNLLTSPNPPQELHVVP